MYRLLFRTSTPDEAQALDGLMEWAREGFFAPLFAPDDGEVARILSEKHPDALIWCAEASGLDAFLKEYHPLVPVLELPEIQADRPGALKDLRRLLNRYHADFSDDCWDGNTLQTVIRDEETRALLTGVYKNGADIRRMLRLMRVPVDFDAPCAVIKMDMPQGELYMSTRWHHGMDRLENALRSNFFGREGQGIWYVCAVLSARSVLLCALPMVQGAPEKIDQAALEHVFDALANAREYLDLDISVVDCKQYDSVLELANSL